MSEHHRSLDRALAASTGKGHSTENDAAVWFRENSAAQSTLGRVREVLIEWGALSLNGDFVDDEDFAEAIRDSGAWRLARDLRTALGVTPPGGGRA